MTDLAPQLFKDVRRWLESMFHFDDPREASIATLFIFQTRCYRLLSTVFYLFIMGPPGSGKTCLLNALAMLGRGLMLGNISVAAMARELGRGRQNIQVGRSDDDVMYHLACFDEFDAEGDKDRHAVMEEILRHGYRWDGPFYIRWDLEGKASVSWDLYMPKVASATSTINPALASRGFRISAAPYDGPDGFGILLNNRYPKEVEELNRRLDDWGNAIRREFTPEKIEEIEKSEEHAKRVEAITGKLGLNRQNEHALTCATIAYLIGIDLTQELQHAVETLTLGNEEYEDDIELLKKAVLDCAKEQATIEATEHITIKQSDVKRRINELREQNHQRPLSDRKFAEIYRVAGIKTSWIRNRGGRNYWVVPLTYISVLEGLVNMPNLANLPENPVQKILKVDQVGQVGLEEKERIAREMRAQGKSDSEIAEVIGKGVLEEFQRRGIVPILGGGGE